MKKEQARSKKRRAALEKTAADLFLKRGYDGVTIDEIVQKAGGSKSTIYSTFGGKCGLFILTIENLCKEFNAPLRDIDYSKLSLEQSLKKLGRALVGLLTKPHSIALHRLVIAEAPRCPEVGYAWYVHGPQATTKLIANVLMSYSGDAKQRASAQATAAIYFYDALSSNILYRLLAGMDTQADAKTLDRLVRETVDLFLRGYPMQ
ncbi:MAG TPA: TetR/AcrR family transcriptional regulator [Acidobacteriaceae bacterium]|nr:TetR/AcrR family transcriptional regulator [Acidobacteriaceae bacterium]